MPPGLMRLPNGRLVPRPAPTHPIAAPTMTGPRGNIHPALKGKPDPFFKTVEGFAKIPGQVIHAIDRIESHRNVQMHNQITKPQNNHWGAFGQLGGFLGGLASAAPGFLERNTNLGQMITGRGIYNPNYHDTPSKAASRALMDVTMWPGALPGVGLGGRAIGAAAKMPWYRQPLVQGAAFRAFKEGYYDPTHPRRR